MLIVKKNTIIIQNRYIIGGIISTDKNHDYYDFKMILYT